ncbi:MAG: transcriptional repressor [Bacilli bacterium]|nr:transcriptional repressor [Bacilli bacterium]
MRNTKQKDLILSIINSSYQHPNAEYIYNECRGVMPNISLGTVYRNLNNLADNGLIKRIKTPSNVDRFDRINDNHAHFICIKCDKIIDLDDSYLTNIDMIDNNKVMDCEVNFKGICEKCIGKGDNNGIKRN